MIRAVPFVRAMAPYALADLGGSTVTSLAQNESAFAPSPAAVGAAQRASRQMLVYPDPDWTDLRTAIADVHGLERNMILCGAGSMELIGCLVRAFSGPGDEVLGTQYGYAFVALAAAQAGATYVAAPETDLTVSVDAILSDLSTRTRIVFVCNPGNPTGTSIANADLLRLRSGLPDDVLMVVDQAYAEFSDAQQDPTEIYALANRGDTVITRTFSKAYGLAGCRVGWCHAAIEIGTQVRKLLNPNNIPAPSQHAAMAAIRDQAHMKNVVRQTSIVRDRFCRHMRAIGIMVPDSHTNFVLLRFHSPDVAQSVDAVLREAGFLLREMGGYGLPDCLRATVCRQAVMTRVAAVIEQTLL